MSGDGLLLDTRAASDWLRRFAAEVAIRRDMLTALDAAIGDADHGVNLDRGMQAVLIKLPGACGPAEVGELAALLKSVGMTLVSTVGGAAGPLYGTLFLEIAKAVVEKAALTTDEWAEAFAAGVAGVQRRGKAEPGDKTMIDALAPAAAALRETAAGGVSLRKACRAAADAAADGMRAATPLVARKGRASYLGERSAGHQDPGATSSWLLLETAALTFEGAPAAPARAGAGSGDEGEDAGDAAAGDSDAVPDVAGAGPGAGEGDPA